MLSLRLVSVLICVVLTLVTAALTLAVALSFTQKAVDDLGLRFSSSLATNLKNQVQEHMQGAASQYLGVALTPEISTVGPPNTTWTPGWNGSFWTFNPADLANVEGHFKTLLTAISSHNFTREFVAVMGFVDGTMVQFAAAPKNLTQFFGWAVVGRGPGPISAAFPTYSVQKNYGYDRQLISSTPTTVTSPTPWALPFCGMSQACSTYEFRLRPQYISGNAYGRGRCWWVAPFISSAPSTATGVYCTMYNALNQRLGVAGNIMTFDAVSSFVSSVSRTANGQAFLIDSANSGLIGSSYSAAFQLVWTWGNATFNATTNSFRNSSRVNPITLRPLLPNKQRFADYAAISANATHVFVKPECIVGVVINYVVCQKSVSNYGYAPLKALQQEVGLDPARGFRQGILKTSEGRFYYAMDGIATYANGYLLPGLLWTVVIMTPESDVTAKVVAGRTYSIVATVLFFVFAAGCCFVLFTIFLRPLAELEDKMLMTANLADEKDKDEPLSSLSEVRSMQKSFYKLRMQLRRLKSFVPQSVLAALDDDDDEASAPASTAGARSVVVDDVGTNRSSKRPDDQSSQTPSSKGSTKKSSTHYTVSSGGQAVRLLNMQVGMVKKVVSVLMFNVFGVHAQLRSLLPEEFVRAHSKLVEHFHAVVTQEKGIVDGFQGDRFVATFNAVTNNAQHAVRACVAGQQIVAGVAKLKLPFARAGVGIASGEALVGNAGAEALRRFCTVGRVYTQATAMERLTKQHATADVIISSGTVAQVRHEFYFEALDAVAFEGSSKPAVVFALRARMNHAMEEWNYAMLQNEAKDRYGALNDAFAKYAEGDPTASRALLSSVGEADRQLEGYQRLSALLQCTGSAMDSAGSGQGRFFAASFGPQ